MVDWHSHETETCSRGLVRYWHENVLICLQIEGSAYGWFKLKVHGWFCRLMAMQGIRHIDYARNHWLSQEFLEPNYDMCGKGFIIFFMTMSKFGALHKPNKEIFRHWVLACFYLLVALHSHNWSKT